MSNPQILRFTSLKMATSVTLTTIVNRNIVWRACTRFEEAVEKRKMKIKKFTRTRLRIQKAYTITVHAMSVQHVDPGRTSKRPLKTEKTRGLWCTRTAINTGTRQENIPQRAINGFLGSPCNRSLLIRQLLPTH